MHVEVFVNGVMAKAMVDSGAGLNVMNKTLFDEIKARYPEVQLKPEVKTVRSVTDKETKSIGSVTVPVLMGSKQTITKFFVIDVPETLILGLPYLKKTAAVVNFGEDTIMIGAMTLPPDFDAQGTSPSEKPKKRREGISK